MLPNPANLAKGDKEDLPTVDQLGVITLDELHEYHCNNDTRRCLSLFGVIFDVTSSEKSYGKDGACKYCIEFLGSLVFRLSFDCFVFGVAVTNGTKPTFACSLSLSLSLSLSTNLLYYKKIVNL